VHRDEVSDELKAECEAYVAPHQLELLQEILACTGL